jgi:hypothetical protein
MASNYYVASPNAIQALIERVEELEKRVKVLEAKTLLIL